ncbi:DUF4293 domain-containing protein [Porphyromonas sp.]|uniref:DUF4293 domain-containing protein n=1 Tax=Porphyromonas sp. TaxID=1924944 RepID=UPI0026DB4E72|nr:DUF4293 domain-containing protein [Porphyromonas sp.]MDO4771375.1 DUF4293 domain-containing protein [Porphyromonas sp.]
MIQRKQTLYLLLSATLMTLVVFLTSAKVFTETHGTYTFTSLGLSDIAGELTHPMWLLATLNILLVLFSFLTIFLFKNRVLQMRFTMFGLLLKIGFITLAYFLLTQFRPEDYTGMSYTPWAALPFLAIILDYLAHRGIAIDERKVRFMDRLR